MNRACAVVILFVGLCGCRNDGSTGPVSELKGVGSADTWVAIEPTQCLTNPWEQDWLSRNNGNYSAYPKDPTTPGLEPEEFAIIQEYYDRQGVVVMDGATAPKYDVVCLACTCPEGHTMFLLVRGEDVEAMIGFGYRIEAPSDHTSP
jgi:hypothetical protein